MLSEEELKEEYELLTTTPELWQYSAEMLETAFGILLKEVEKANTYPFNHELGEKVLLPFYLLVGYALENMFKGICVANSIYMVKDGKFTGCSHNLIDHAKNAGFNNLTNDEKWLLQRIQAVTVWGGRYPTPTSQKQLDYNVIKPDGTSGSLLSWTNHDIPLLKTFYKRVKEKFEYVLKTKGKVIKNS